jgi:hypothetical protein
MMELRSSFVPLIYLLEEKLSYHWAGTVIYTLALQSVSLSVRTIARSFEGNPVLLGALSDCTCVLTLRDPVSSGLFSGLV